MATVLTCDLCGAVLTLNQETEKPFSKVPIPAAVSRSRFTNGTTLYICEECIESKLFAQKDEVDRELSHDLEHHMDGSEFSPLPPEDEDCGCPKD